ncbi:hypothetical protein [Rhodopila sp.]|uniref:hypothetical protein n=1 Tax=Rhodopila sp. TaxID=2480087 RepID=UPI003D0BF66F
MKQRYVRQSRAGKATPAPDLIRLLLDHLGYREDMAPEPKQDLRFAAADALEDTYFRMMAGTPGGVRRNMSLHVVIDKATALLEGDGIIPAGSGMVPTDTERAFWTRHFPGMQYTPATSDKPKPP